MKVPISYWESIIKKGIEEGLSGNQILRRAREAGLAIRTKTFYEIYNSVKASMDFENIIKDWPREKKIPEWLLPSRPVNIPTKYAFIFEVEDPELGIVQRFGVYTDDLEPLENYYQKARDMSIAFYDLQPSKIRLIRAYRKKTGGK